MDSLHVNKQSISVAVHYTILFNLLSPCHLLCIYFSLTEFPHWHHRTQWEKQRDKERTKKTRRSPETGESVFYTTDHQATKTRALCGSLCCKMEQANAEVQQQSSLVVRSSLGVSIIVLCSEGQIFNITAPKFVVYNFHILGYCPFQLDIL
jgi:hypothetical protein